MKKRILIVTTMLAMVAIGSFNVHAAPMPRMRGPMAGKCAPAGPGREMQGCWPEKIIELLVVVLDLSGTQEEQVRKILDDERVHHEKLARETREEEQKLHRMLGADVFDEEAFQSLGMNVAKKRLDMMMAGPKLKTQVLAMLNTEQRTKAEKILNLVGPPPTEKRNQSRKNPSDADCSSRTDTPPIHGGGLPTLF